MVNFGGILHKFVFFYNKLNIYNSAPTVHGMERPTSAQIFAIQRRKRERRKGVSEIFRRNSSARLRQAIRRDISSRLRQAIRHNRSARVWQTLASLVKPDFFHDYGTFHWRTFFELHSNL